MCTAGTEWVDPEDPTVIAENELLGAAAAIEAAAKKLEQLRPRTKPKVKLFTQSLLTLAQGHSQNVHHMNDGCATHFTMFQYFSV